MGEVIAWSLYPSSNMSEDRIALDPEDYGLLTEMVNETYLDGIDRVEGAWVVGGDRIEAIVWDENRQFVVSMHGDDLNIMQTNDETYTPMTASFAGAKKRNCKVGISCGNTCISKGKTCKKKASAGQKENSKAILKKATSKLDDQLKRSERLTDLLGKMLDEPKQVKTPKQRLEDTLKDTPKPLRKQYKEAQAIKGRKAEMKKSVLGLPSSASLLDHKKALVKVKNATGGTGAKYERAKAEYDRKASKI